MLSLTLIAIASEGVAASSSERLASAALTCASVPTIASVVLPFEDVTVAPPALLADSTPCISATLAVNVSPSVVGVSATLTPPIAAACPTPSVIAAGALINGVPDVTLVTLTSLAEPLGATLKTSPT